MAEGRRRPIQRAAIPLLLLLFASFIQFHLHARAPRFLPDEAFFMTFARGAAVNGDWLLPGPLDKPPLSIYFSAWSMVAVGITADAGGVLQLDPLLGEFAGRLPNAFMAITLVALMMRLAWRIYDCRWAALLAGLLAASSPYLLAYGPSAFTDISLLFWSTAALYFALTGRWALAGAALGLAFWSKQQAALFALLIVLILLALRARRHQWLRLALAFCPFCAALLAWDFARPETSLFLQAAANNAPESWLADPALWGGRLRYWLGLGLWLLGPAIVTGVLLLAAAFVSLRRRGADAAVGNWLSVEGALLLYIVGYFGAHTILQFNTYDRYLLLILPPAVILVAGRLARLPAAARRGKGLRSGIAVLLVLSGLWLMQAGGRIGGDRGLNDGVDALAAHLNAKPVATVIYDPWLGWELGYYLGQWHDKRRVHYPSAEALVAGALALAEAGDRYFVAPTDQPHLAWLAALDAAGFGLALDYEGGRFLVYRVTPPRD